MSTRGELNRLRINVLAEDSVGYDSPYLGQHGISILITSQSEDAERSILVDVAQNPDALLENMAKMGIAASCIDTVVLTHCHYDHTKGLGRILQEIGKKDLPVIAHPELFRLNFVTDPYLRHVGVMHGDEREEIESSGGMLFLTRDPLELMPGLSTTGEVERITDFEEVGMGFHTLQKGEIQTDQMRDDISVVANIKGKGLVIVTGCSHAGIVNILKQAVKLTGTDKVHGIIGGFHLIEASDTVIEKTGQAIAELNPDWVYAGHCTGFRAQVKLYNRLRERFSPLHTGMVVEIS